MGNIDGQSIQQFILYMVALVFSLSVHESAHAWMSNQFGDDLARLQGRISLNPASHVDPIGPPRAQWHAAASKGSLVFCGDVE